MIAAYGLQDDDMLDLAIASGTVEARTARSRAASEERFGRWILAASGIVILLAWLSGTLDVIIVWSTTPVALNRTQLQHRLFRMRSWFNPANLVSQAGTFEPHVYAYGATISKFTTKGVPIGPLASSKDDRHKRFRLLGPPRPNPGAKQSQASDGSQTGPVAIAVLTSGRKHSRYSRTLPEGLDLNALPDNYLNRLAKLLGVKTSRRKRPQIIAKLEAARKLGRKMRADELEKAGFVFGVIRKARSEEFPLFQALSSSTMNTDSACGLSVFGVSDDCAWLESSRTLPYRVLDTTQSYDEQPSVGYIVFLAGTWVGSLALALLSCLAVVGARAKYNKRSHLPALVYPSTRAAFQRLTDAISTGTGDTGSTAKTAGFGELIRRLPSRLIRPWAVVHPDTYTMLAVPGWALEGSSSMLSRELHVARSTMARRFPAQVLEIDLRTIISMQFSEIAIDEGESEDADRAMWPCVTLIRGSRIPAADAGPPLLRRLSSSAALSNTEESDLFDSPQPELVTNRLITAEWPSSHAGVEVIALRSLRERVELARRFLSLQVNRTVTVLLPPASSTLFAQSWLSSRIAEARSHPSVGPYTGHAHTVSLEDSTRQLQLRIAKAEALVKILRDAELALTEAREYRVVPEPVAEEAAALSALQALFQRLMEAPAVVDVREILNRHRRTITPLSVLLDDDQSCTICMCPFEAGQDVITWPCAKPDESLDEEDPAAHSFCADCALRWGTEHDTCPICRSKAIA